MANATDLTVVIKAKDEASGTLDKVGKKAGGFGGAMGKAGKKAALGVGMMATAVVGFGVASVKSFAEAGDEVQKMALRTGLSTEALSELKYAAELSGTSLTGIETGMKKMAKFVDDANDGLSTSTDVLDKLGLSVTDIQGLSPEETFKVLSSAVADTDDALTRAALAQDVFGKAGTDMLPMLAAGSEGIQEMRDEAHELGVVFDQDAADKAAAFNDSLSKLQNQLGGVMNQVAQGIMPALEPLIEAFSMLIENIPIEQFAELAAKVLPKLVGLFVRLLDAIPLDMIINFVMLALEPMFQILEAVMTILEPLLKLLEPVFQILGMILELLQPIIDGITWVAEKAAGAIGGVTEWVGGLFGGASGAIVTKPTLSLIGEKGPEAVMPLSSAPGAMNLAGAGFAAGNITVNVHGSVIGQQDLAKVIHTEIRRGKGRNFTAGLA